jgi:hypothetical protein
MKLICWITGILFIFFFANSILTALIQKKIRQQLQELSPQAQVGLSSIYSNLLTAALSINDLSLDIVSDSGHQHTSIHSIPDAHHVIHIKKVSNG